MYAGAQVSLYPMSDDFMSVITRSIGALDPYRDRFRIETDDLSTVLVGPPDDLFPAMRDLFVSAAATGVHTVVSACVSRGCLGGPEEELARPSEREWMLADPVQNRERCRAAVAAAPQVGQHVSAQFAYYPLGAAGHMEGITACIDFLEVSGVLDRPKNFLTKLTGDAGPVFATLSQAFLCFAPPGAHVTLDVTVSANSPSRA